MMFDFNYKNFYGFSDFVINGNTIISVDKQVPDLTLTHFADEYLIEITNNDTNTITLIYDLVRWNLDFDLGSKIKMRCSKRVPETNQINYTLNDLQQVWAINTQ